MNKFLIFFLVTMLTACSGSSRTAPIISGEWLVPINEVFDGGPGRDGIPALENPAFISVANAGYLADDDLVVGVKIGADIRAYPHRILNWHEISNDTFTSEKVSINYCPLTGSAMIWNGSSTAANPTFGVSGLLYNSNLILYDRETDTNWSQMLIKGVNGSLSGELPTSRVVFETTWGTWKTMFPTTTVLSTNTGFSRDYTQYPYGSYRTNTNLIFPAANDDARLHKKERVLGVFGVNANKVYQIQQFSAAVDVINEAAGEYVVIGSSGSNFAVALLARASDGVLLTFTALSNSNPQTVMVDNEGNEWNVFGEAVAGTRTGQSLPRIKSFIAYWFAWSAFYPNAEIHF